MSKQTLGSVFIASFLLACGAPQDAERDGARGDIVSNDAVITRDGLSMDDRAALPMCEPACGPGQVCRVGGRCESDCRATGAVSCAAPESMCDMLTGRCLDPACPSPGETVSCGATEFPAYCGPGSVCNEGLGRCQAAPGCERLVCDAAGNCRGVGCTGPTDMIEVRGLSVEPPAVGAPGMPGGLRARARVDASAYCGLQVTFEVRRDEAFYISAGTDAAIWKIDLDGTRTSYLRGIGQVSGLTADRTGALYYMLTRTGEIRRVASEPGGGMPPVTETYANTGAPSSGRGVARIVFGPDGLLYAANRSRVQRVEADHAVTTVVLHPGLFSDTITGLTFDRDGSLVYASIFPTVYRVAPGTRLGMMGAAHYDVTAITPDSRTVQDFFHEALALGPDGLLYGGSFPSDVLSGQVYRVESEGPRTVAALAQMRMAVPSTRYAGIHGIAFGACGDLFFVNQNTNGNTREPLGQLLVLRAASGRIELVNEGFNLEWPDGFDGDLVIAQRTLGRAVGRVSADGTAQALVDVPSTPGCYQLRALLTDPRTGAIREARGAFTVR